MAENQGPQIDRKWRTWNLKSFHGGLNNRDSDTSLNDFELIKATGVQVNAFGKITLNGFWVYVGDSYIPPNQDISLGLICPGKGLFHFRNDYQVINTSGTLRTDLVYEENGVDILLIQNGDFFHIRQEYLDSNSLTRVDWAYNIINIQEPGQFDEEEDSPSEDDLELLDSIPSFAGYFADKRLVICDSNFKNENTITPRPLIKTLKFYNVEYFGEDSVGLPEFSNTSTLAPLGMGNQTDSSNYTTTNTYGDRSYNGYFTYSAEAEGGMPVLPISNLLEDPFKNKPGVSASLYYSTVSSEDDAVEGGFQNPWFSHSFPRACIQQSTMMMLDHGSGSYQMGDMSGPQYILESVVDSSGGYITFTTQEQHNFYGSQQVRIVGTTQYDGQWTIHEPDQEARTFKLQTPLNGTSLDSGAYVSRFVHNDTWKIMGGVAFGNCNNYNFTAAWGGVAPGLSDSNWLFGGYLTWAFSNPQLVESYKMSSAFNMPSQADSQVQLNYWNYTPSDSTEDWNSISDESFDAYVEAADKSRAGDANYSTAMRLNIKAESTTTYRSNMPGLSGFAPTWLAAPFKPSHTPAFGKIHIYVDILAIRDYHGPFWDEGQISGSQNRQSLFNEMESQRGLKFVTCKLRAPRSGSMSLSHSITGNGLLSGGMGTYRWHNTADPLYVPPSYESKRYLIDIAKEANPNLDFSRMEPQDLELPWRDCYIGSINCYDAYNAGHWYLAGGQAYGGFWDSICIGAHLGDAPGFSPGSYPEGAIDFANWRFKYEAAGTNLPFFPLNADFSLNKITDLHNTTDEELFRPVLDSSKYIVSNNFYAPELFDDANLLPGETSILQDIYTTQHSPIFLKFNSSNADYFTRFSLQANWGYSFEQESDVNVFEWNTETFSDTFGGNSTGSLLSTFKGFDYSATALSLGEDGLPVGTLRVNARTHSEQSIQPRYNSAQTYEPYNTDISNAVLEQGYNGFYEDDSELNYTFSKLSDPTALNTGHITVKAAPGVVSHFNTSFLNEEQGGMIHIDYTDTGIRLVQSLVNEDAEYNNFIFTQGSRDDIEGLPSIGHNFYDTIHVNTKLNIGETYAIFQDNSGVISEDNKVEFITITEQLVGPQGDVDTPIHFKFIDTDDQVFDMEGVEYNDVSPSMQVMNWNNSFTNENGDSTVFDLTTTNLGEYALYTELFSSYEAGTSACSLNVEYDAYEYKITRNYGTILGESLFKKVIVTGENSYEGVPIYSTSIDSLLAMVKANWKVDIENSDRYELAGMETIQYDYGIAAHPLVSPEALLSYQIQQYNVAGVSIQELFPGIDDQTPIILRKLFNELTYMRLRKAFGKEMTHTRPFESRFAQGFAENPSDYDLSGYAEEDYFLWNQWYYNSFLAESTEKNNQIISMDINGLNNWKGRKIFNGEYIALAMQHALMNPGEDNNFSYTNFLENNTWWADPFRQNVSTAFNDMASLNSYWSVTGEYRAFTYSDFWSIPFVQPVVRTKPYIADATLAEDLNDTETLVDVSNGNAFSENMTIKIDDEFMRISSISSNTLTVRRGTDDSYQPGMSEKATHDNGASIQIRPKMELHTCGFVPVEIDSDRFKNQIEFFYSQNPGVTLPDVTFLNSSGEEVQIADPLLEEDDDLVIEYYRHILNQLTDTSGLTNLGDLRSCVKNLINYFWEIDL